MKQRLLMILMLSFSLSSMGGLSPKSYTVCKVGNFDQINVDLHCDARHNFKMKTPRKWLKGKKIVRGKSITLEVDKDFALKWYKLNAKRHGKFLKKLALKQKKNQSKNKNRRNQ
jgi:hypothetical protein